MKIIFILSGTTLYGGATKSFLNLHKYLVTNGDETMVITPDQNGIFNVLKSEGVNVLNLKYGFNTISLSRNPIHVLRSFISYLLNLIYSYFALKKILSTCETFHPDLIHTNSSVNIIGYLLAKKLGKPHIWHIREYGDLDFNFKIPFLSRKLRKKNNYSICITKGIAKHLKCFNQKNSKVIYNGIISECENIFKPIASRNYFLYAGRIEKAKGLIDLIEAYHIYVMRKGYEYLPLKIIGGIGDKKYYEATLRMIDEYDLSDKIELLGEVSNPLDYFQNALAVIVPSYNEGFGRVAAEAMAVGTIVIGRNTAGTKEQFDNGIELMGDEIGIRFNNIEDLSNKIYEVASWNDNSNYYKIIQRAQKCVINLYAYEKYGKSIRDYYKQILKLTNEKTHPL